MTPEDLIQRFHLAPLTGEGGLYRRTYCSARELPAEAFGPQYPAGTRVAAGSASSAESGLLVSQVVIPSPQLELFQNLY